jgi:septal ring factor EnvC (AmiA/AmiB activator)
MHFRRNTDVDGDGVYALTRRTIEQSEARVASLKREIALLEEIIAQNRSFLERIEGAALSRTAGNAPIATRIGGSVKPLVQRAKADKRLRGSETYAASILAVLAKHPRGLTTAELTAYFRDVRHPIAERSDAAKAVSNQLSQLKAKHLVVRDRQKRFTLQS